MANLEWKMPLWMEKYRNLFCNLGGNTLETLLSGPRTLVAINAPRAICEVSAECQTVLLNRLYENGHLRSHSLED